ncbi:Uromodulin-like 1 [Aix galericulata]|nr:Uromodulin-like 1 [Aix galericulata]
MARIPTLVLVLILWAATQQGKGNEITEKGLSLLGYHLCNYSLTKNVFKMVAYQKSYEKNTSCGGWIPWMVCPRTYYKTQYHTVKVPETTNLTDCCEGYEQVGLYCSLALNRSSVFASRPGICPMENMETSDYPCTFDAECPGLKKCCNSSKGEGCVDPKPEERIFWYNVTVLVKMDFNELIRVDSHLLNHSRLLHSMITGALQPLNASVHHIQSNQAEIYSGTVASQVLIGLHQPAPLAEVSSSLKDIVKRVYEVIDTDVQDVNECSYAEFNACPKQNTCVNLEGYYSCNPENEHADVNPQQLSSGKDDPSAIRNHRIFSVTSNSFEMSWHVESTLNHTFQVQVFKGKEMVQNLKTEEMKMNVSGLEAGVMYSVEISYETCGKTSISHQNVKTEAKIFGVTMRILNYNFTEDFHDTSSSAYEEFSRLLLTEIVNSFPPNITALYEAGKLKVQTKSLQAGSIIVRLRIAVQDPGFPVDASTFAPMLSYLYNGSVLLVDQQNSAIEDWDECASHAENDCSMFADCINVMGSYLCRCKTTVDTNPSRPGRNCEAQEQSSSSLSVLPNQTASSTTRSHVAFGGPQVHSQGGPSTAPPVTGDAGASTLNATLDTHTETGGENSSWSEKYTTTLGSPALPGFSSASSSMPSSAVDRSEYASSGACTRGNAPMWETKPQSESQKMSSCPQWSGLKPTELSQRPVRADDLPACSPPWSMNPCQSPTNLPEGKSSVETHKPLLQELYLRVAGLAARSSSIWVLADPCQCFFSAFVFCLLHVVSFALPGIGKTKEQSQKLNGMVRITNVKYSPGFSNASSEEYQNFAQLFVDEVHKSLPLEVLQQVDAGLIKVLITGITNGSTVVSFHLLIAEDVDIYYIITTFRDAFEHSSYFTVDNSSLSINDYDECKSEEDDCSPDASCYNTLGFYQCSCNDGFADHMEDTKFSSVVLPPLTTDPASTPDVPPQASPVPLVKPAQEISIKDAVRVFCEIEKIVLAIQKEFLDQESIPESSLYLGEPRCNVSISNGTHAVLQAGWSECGTEIETNESNTTVKTILRNDASAQGVIHHLKVASPIHCVFQNNLLTSSGYTAEGVYTIFEDLHGSGHFRTEMQLFIGNSPIPKNFSVSASDDILIEVGIQRADSKLKVVLTDCWATPTNNSVDPLSFTFINNSCPIPNTYTTLLENGNSSKAQFKLKIFSFVNNSVVYLHCKIRICMETPGSTCRTRCHAARSLKTGEIIAIHRTSWGPLCKSAASDSNTEKESGMRVGYIILIAVAVFGFVVGVVSLVIFQYQRKMGRYNFRIKSDNFSYQVFYN